MPRHQHDAVRITTAAPPRSEDLNLRQRRYLISMAIRTLCFIGAVAVGAGLLRWTLIGGAVFLPYLAVVLANAMPPPRKDVDLRQDWFGRELSGGTPENPGTTDTSVDRHRLTEDHA